MGNKTLIVCFGPLGRLLNGFCAVARLRETCPDDQLVLLTDPSMVGLATKAPWFDDVISANLSDTEVKPSQLTKAIKQRKFDRIIDLERSTRTRKLFAGFGLFAPKFAGAAPRAKWRVAANNAHPIDADDLLLDAMGIGKTHTDLSLGPQLDWLLRLAGQTPSTKPGYFGLDGPYILLNLGKSQPDQGWPETAFAELSEQLIASGITVAITGNINARELAKPLLRAFPQICDLCARADPFQLAALGTEAKGVVGLPDGILHLCAAGAGRCISLHGSQSSAEQTAIRSPNAMTLIGEPLDTLLAKDVLRTMKMFGAL
ncbi:hypothetical protein MNBD_ALPHA06-389 [hydrothermal vent metagenome]|uniref:ADP-heptose--lipooligosaccharide heptosyltransferase II n=1 Tax=hydrothermal vent metagenome TaxID=652676 RepID=A0A3B0RWT2_9ZZZZ